MTVPTKAAITLQKLLPTTNSSAKQQLTVATKATITLQKLLPTKNSSAKQQLQYQKLLLHILPKIHSP